MKNRTTIVRVNSSLFLYEHRYNDAGDTMKLTEIRPHQRMIIKKLNVSESNRRRLLHLGFYPGATITLEQFAPLHDPMLFDLLGNLITLRRQDAQYIEVEEMGEAIWNIKSPL